MFIAFVISIEPAAQTENISSGRFLKISIERLEAFYHKYFFKNLKKSFRMAICIL